MPPQQTLTEFDGGTPRPLRERHRTAETGCACPECKKNIASTHGEHHLSVSSLPSDLRDEIPTPTVRMNGWVCDDCNLLVPRDMEESNSCWSRMTNAEKTYVGVLVARPMVGDKLVVPIHQADLPARFTNEASLFCTICDTEYGGCVTTARVPCRPCRGGAEHRSWTKSWGEEVRLKPLKALHSQI